MNWLWGVILAVVLATILALSFRLDGRSAEWDEAATLELAQKAAQLAARQERAAAQLCKKLKGPNGAHRWTVDNELVCFDAKSRGGK